MHSFALKCPNAEELLQYNTLSKFVKASARLATTAEAIKVYEVGSYKDFEILNDSNFQRASMVSKILWICY